MSPDNTPPRTRDWIYWALGCWGAALALTFAGFVYVHHSGPWVSKVQPRSIPGSRLEVVRGTARVADGAVVLERPGGDGTLIASLAIDPPVEARDYRIVQVHARGAFPREGLSLVWRTDKGGERLPRVAVVSSGGRVLPNTLGAIDGWSDRIVGLGLVSRGPFAGPLVVERIDLRPASVWTTVDAIVSDWLEFEPWDGGSIHFMAGGNPSLRYPLPLFLGIAFLAATGLYLFLILLGHTRFAPQAVLAIALLGWAVVDARWQWNLWKQLDLTRWQYAGKSWEDKRRAAEDGPLFAFMHEAKARIGDAPGHVFVFADSEFERMRGAYHLYPRNVAALKGLSGFLPAATYRPGDVLVIYRKRGIEFNAADKRLRWDRTQAVSAELLLLSEGSAVFRVLGPG